MTSRVAIVGAGMAGLSCAEALASVGYDVALMDKARGPGGRMSTRRMQTPLGEMAFDHGAQYFTARDPGFLRAVAEWAAHGIVAEWPLAGHDAWIGTPGMNAVIKAMASGHDVRWGTLVSRIERHAGGWTVQTGDARHTGFDAVVLAIPAEQAVPHLSLLDFTMARQAMLARSQPCWTAMFAFAAPLPGNRDMVRDTGIIGWAARNGAKPGRQGPEGWVVQAAPEWTSAHIEDDPAEVLAQMLSALSDVLEAALPPPVAAAAHRWRYAMSAGLGHGSLWNAGLGLGVCGDWLLGPRIECAWQSGQHLARAIAESPVAAADRPVLRAAG